MKAVICTKYGAPEVLKLREVEKPTPMDHEVLVKIHATTVTAGDVRMRKFDVPLSFWLPARLALGIRKPKRAIPGMELAGEIVAIGAGVTRFEVGDQVLASVVEHNFGAYAEYICLPEDGVIAKTAPTMSYEQVAAVPIGGRTALYFLREANIQEGDQVLIYGASGSVGTWAVQIAKYFGAHVAAVCSGANLDLVRSLGADEVVDYTKEDFTRNGVCYDVIFDTVGKAPYAGSIRSLKEGGSFLHAVATPGVSVRMRWSEMSNGVNTVGGGPPPDAADLETLNELFEASGIKPVIDRVYPLEEIVEAHRYVGTGRKKGNVVVTVEKNGHPV